MEIDKKQFILIVLKRVVGYLNSSTRKKIAPRKVTITDWMIPASIVEGLTPEQIKQVLAIKYVPTHSVKVTVSEGVEVVMGRIAENSMGGQKEVMQLWIDHLDKYLKNVSFGSPQPLNKAFKR